MAFETGDEQQQQLSATAATALQQLQHLLASLTNVCTNSTANLVAFTTRVIKIVRLVAETTCFFTRGLEICDYSLVTQKDPEITCAPQKKKIHDPGYVFSPEKIPLNRGA